MSTANRKVLAGFGLAGAGLMMSSAAFACTVYKGDLTATGSGSSAIQTVSGTNSGMTWCALPTPTVKVNKGSASITLNTAPHVRSTGCKASQLTSTGTYSVAVTAPGAGYMPQGGGSGAVHNCHGNTGQVILPNTGTVTTSGVFSPSTIPYTPTDVTKAGPQSVCIYNTAGFADAIAINMDSV